MNQGLECLKKYRYICLTVLLGVILLLWPQRNEPSGTTTQNADESQADTAQEDSCGETALEERLTALLSQISGVGNVACMVTFQDNGVREYLTDKTVDASGAERTQTVILEREGEGQEPVLITASKACIQGVAVVCDGGDDPTVRLQLIQAVSAVTGLGSNHITVVKRESNQH